MVQTDNIQIIIATNENGWQTQTLLILCKVQNPGNGFDLQDAARQAVKEYLHTEKGKEKYLSNGKRFNWVDFVANVPNSINIKHGFETIQTVLDDICVDVNEYLADWQDMRTFWGSQLEEKEDISVTA